MTFSRTLLSRQSNTVSSARPTIKLIGAKANRYLSAPGFSGQVIAAGTQSAYIATDNGNILAACPMDQQPHPRSFLTDLDFSTIHVGLRTSVEGAELRFSNGIALDLSDRQVWNRQPPVASRAPPPQTLLSRCEELFLTALNIHEGENLGLALPILMMDGDAADSGNLRNSTSPLIDAGIEQVRRLLPLCRRGNLQSVLQLADQLIGLGPGLTPSGDDFIGGLIFMSFHLNATYPAERWWGSGDIGGLLARSELMTTQISHVLLTDLAEGQSHASLHDLTDALLTDSEGFVASRHVGHVTAIGHGSGWDMLTGMLAGLLPVVCRV